MASNTAIPAPPPIRIMVQQDGLLDPRAPTLEYIRRNGEVKTVLKWGQLKLLMTEIQFLTHFWNPQEVPNPIVVYAGAAGGNHIPYLSMLFPQVHFHLYDPREFEIQPTDKITIHTGTPSGYMTDEVAKEWSNRSDVLFISDIRTVGKEGDPKDVEAGVLSDMRQQERWVEIMNPVSAHLKFRLPYMYEWSTEAFTNYLFGHVFLQPWTGPTSTETRLVPIRDRDGKWRKVEWSNLRYQDQLFYHNVVIREQAHYLNPFTKQNDAIRTPDMPNNYDMVLTANIFIAYLQKIGLSPTREHVIKLVDAATRMLEKSADVQFPLLSRLQKTLDERKAVITTAAAPAPRPATRKLVLGIARKAQQVPTAQTAGEATTPANSLKTPE